MRSALRVPALLSAVAALGLPGCSADSFAPASAGSAGSAGSGGASAGAAGASGAAAAGRGGSGATAGAAGAAAGTAGGASGLGGSGSGGGGAGSGGGGSGGVAGADAGGKGGAGGASAGSSGAAGSAGLGGAAGTAGASAGSGGVAGTAGAGGASGPAGNAGAAGSSSTNGGAAGTGGAAGSGGNAGTGGNAGGGGNAGTGGGAGEAGSAGAGGATDLCPVLYVSLAASVSGNGCSPDAPLPSLASALQIARTRVITPNLIALCAGDYPPSQVPLVVDVPVDIVGGYLCSGEVFEPAPPAGNTKSTLELGASTLLALTTTDGKRHKVERLGLVPSKTGPTAIGLRVGAGSSAAIHKVDVDLSTALERTTAANERAGSVALSVEPGGTAVITASQFVAGPGRALDAGSVGSAGAILAAPGLGMSIQSTTIRGGEGASLGGGLGAAGLIFAYGSAGLSLTDNTIRAGRGTVSGIIPNNGDANVSIGVLVQPAPGNTAPPMINVGVDGGSIDGGSGQTSSGASASRTVALSISGTKGGRIIASLSHLRLYGGDPSSRVVGDPLASRSVGLFLAEADVEASSSLLHGGGANGDVYYPRAVELLASHFTGSFVTVVPGVSKESPPAFDGSNAVGFFFSGTSDTVSLGDSIIAAASPNTSAFYAEDSACAPNTHYKVGALRVAYLHPESAPGTVSGRKGGLALGSMACPIVPELPAAAPSEPSDDDYFAFASVFHMGPASGTQHGFQTNTPCPGSGKCLQVLFTDYTKTPEDVLEPFDDAFVPACASASPPLVGAGVLSKDVPDDVDRINRGNGTTFLGALVGNGCPTIPLP